LLEVLRRRIATFDPGRQRAHAERGRRLAEALRGAFDCPAAGVSPHVYWVFPILTDRPDAVRVELLRHGFDSTQGQSMIAVDAPPGRDDLEPREARRLLDRILFLPFYEAMPDGELERMAAVLLHLAGGTGVPQPARTPASAFARPSETSPGAGRDLVGRTCVITGATSGIGLEIARALAARGAALVPIGRDPQRTRQVAEELAAAGSPSVSAVIADLADLRAVRNAAHEIAQRHPAIHVLVNNAGIWITQPASSADGIELTWATNVLAHHVLTCALMDRLRAATAARIVNVASTFAGSLDLDDVEFKRRRWSGIAAYRQSKAAQRMWTWALAARLTVTGVTANAIHPGGIYTGIYRSPRGIAGAMIRYYARLAKATPREGADTPVWVATAPELEGVTGRFWAARKEVSCPYRDAASLERLWKLLEAQAAQAAGVAPTRSSVPGAAHEYAQH
jgi:NAD(P)-dependent dehydrogenase (short-subunit alcohol dehydrogenase family)